MVPDTRDEAAIRSGVHAVAHMPCWSRVVRGVDRFTLLPTRERAAVVWVEARHGRGGYQCEVVDLDFIEVRPGSPS